MAGPALDNTRGILRARRGLERFQMSRQAPSRELAPFLDYLWILTWDLRGREPHRQQVLTHPSVHMTFMTGGRARVAGIVRGLFTEQIEETGRVVGARFRPGGFRPFLGAPVSTITDRFVPVEEIFGAEGRDLADHVIAASDAAGAIALAEDFLLARAPAPDPAIALVAGVVERIAGDPSILRVDELAGLLGMGTRRLQRLFNDYVGVGPKWVIRQYRMHEAADRANAGTPVDWAALAVDLGYADQAHFTRDFTMAVGMSPERYARDCTPASDR
jgi:AraC-like DNA-binding protein